MYRACLRELFSLIESDMYGLNRLDMYNGYRDHDKFLKKFKNTFAQISKTWDREAIQLNYFSSKLDRLLEIKTERDETTHPKSPDNFKQISAGDFLKLKLVFNDYDDFINSLMNGFFIGMKNFPLDKLKNQK